MASPTLPPGTMAASELSKISSELIQKYDEVQKVLEQEADSADEDRVKALGNALASQLKFTGRAIQKAATIIGKAEEDFRERQKTFDDTKQATEKKLQGKHEFAANATTLAVQALKKYNEQDVEIASLNKQIKDLAQTLTELQAQLSQARLDLIDARKRPVSVTAFHTEPKRQRTTDMKTMEEFEKELPRLWRMIDIVCEPGSQLTVQDIMSVFVKITWINEFVDRVGDFCQHSAKHWFCLDAFIASDSKYATLDDFPVSEEGPEGHEQHGPDCIVFCRKSEFTGKKTEVMFRKWGSL